MVKPCCSGPFAPWALPTSFLVPWLGAGDYATTNRSDFSDRRESSLSFVGIDDGSCSDVDPCEGTGEAAVYRRSPKFLGEPSVEHAVDSDPGQSRCLVPLCRHSILPSALHNTSASAYPNYLTGLNTFTLSHYGLLPPLPGLHAGDRSPFVTCRVRYDALLRLVTSAGFAPAGFPKLRLAHVRRKVA